MTGATLAIEAAGWIGALLILLAYGLLTAGRLNAGSLIYQAMNAVGAVGFALNGWWHGAIPSTALNIVWLLIALVALARIVKRGREPAGDDRPR